MQASDRTWAEARSIVERAPCRPTEKLVLQALHSFSGGSDECWPSVRAIIEVTGLADRTIRRTVGRLQSRGYLSIESRRRQNGSTRSNRYVFDFAAMALAYAIERNEPGLFGACCGGHSDRGGRQRDRGGGHSDRGPRSEDQPLNQPKEPKDLNQGARVGGHLVGPYAMLRELGVLDPVRAQLVLAGITRDDIKATWTAVRKDPARGTKRIRDPLAVFLARVCSKYKVPIGNPNRITFDAETVTLAARLDAKRESAEGKLCTT